MLDKNNYYILERTTQSFFWRELQSKKEEMKNNLTSTQWFDYSKHLYEQYSGIEEPPRVNKKKKLFTLQEVKEGIKKLRERKDRYMVELQVEYLKSGMEIISHIMNIFNNIIQCGFPKDWITSLAIPLIKSGEVNNPSNY